MTHEKRFTLLEKQGEPRLRISYVTSLPLYV